MSYNEAQVLFAQARAEADNPSFKVSKTLAEEMMHKKRRPQILWSRRVRIFGSKAGANVFCWDSIRPIFPCKSAFSCKPRMPNSSH